MAQRPNPKSNQPARSISVALMLMITSLLSLTTPGVSAVGVNQNDLGSGGDLPDNTTVNITNYIFSGTYNGTENSITVMIPIISE